MGLSCWNYFPTFFSPLCWAPASNSSWHRPPHWKQRDTNKCYYSSVKREEKNQNLVKWKNIPDISIWCLIDISEVTFANQGLDSLSEKRPDPQPSSFQLMPSVWFPLLRWKTLESFLTPSFLLHPTNVNNLSTQPSKCCIWNLPSTYHLYCHDLCSSWHHPLPARCNYHLSGLPLFVLGSSSLLWTEQPEWVFSL